MLATRFASNNIFPSDANDDYNQNPSGYTFVFDEYDVKGVGSDFNESEADPEFDESGSLTSDILLTKGDTYDFILKPHAPYVAQNPFNFHSDNLDKLVVRKTISNDATSPVTVDFGEICLGDLDQNEIVDSVDVAIIISPDVFYKHNIDFDSGDLNRDGIVNTYDWSIVNRCHKLATEN